jgi:spore germination cell wall hydrolase CwlJ-like protein
MPLAPIDDYYVSDPTLLLALCVWREARGEPSAAKLGVAWVVRNRCAMAPAQGFKPDVAGNVLKPWAFSSFMTGDPNSRLYPGPNDRAWRDSLAAAQSDDPDPTGGAVFYYSAPVTEPPNAWGDVEHAADIGRLRFYRIVAAG